jgi:hypothetical protein
MSLEMLRPFTFLTDCVSIERVSEVRIDPIIRANGCQLRSGRDSRSYTFTDGRPKPRPRLTLFRKKLGTGSAAPRTGRGIHLPGTG